MTEDKENKKKKIASLRSFDKREAQSKSLKEKELEQAVVLSPEIYYDNNPVNDIHIWLDMIDNYSTIYIGPFISKDGKGSHIGLRYTLDTSKHAKFSNDSEDEIVSDWTINKMERIVVKHNRQNTGITIEKIFGIFPPKDDKVKKSMYIPMSRIFLIVTNENPYNRDTIEK